MNNLNQRLCLGNMIKTKENYIGFFQTVNLAMNSVFVKINNRIVEYDPEEIKGIPLTKEWIELAKFSLRSGGVSFESRIENKIFTLYINDPVLVSCRDSSEVGANHSLHHYPIKYLHQLQNLYQLTFESELLFNEYELKKTINFKNHLAHAEFLVKQTEERLLLKNQEPQLLLDNTNNYRGFEGL